ncbi:MAG TPA: class I SAM-dependent methyltransferase [Pseudolabrys sp.]
MILKSPSTAPTACKICNEPAPLFGVVDFNKSCEDRRGLRLPVSGTPVYYRRCQGCGFLFTDAFDDWTAADFKTYIYNDGYLEVDPDYAEIRPRSNAGVVAQLFGAHKAERRVLDFGGGNDVLCSVLRAGGFPHATTYDPFTPAHAQPPEGMFDLITCFETLEHMPDPAAGIAAIIAHLAEPGMVVFSTLLQPQDFASFGLNWWYAGPRNGHVSLYSKNALVLAWRKFGFQTASFSDILHVAFRTLPAFAKHLLK